MTGVEAVGVWLMTPLSSAETHRIAPWVAWHARLMVLGWTILLPLGMLIARFFKITRRQDWPRVLDNAMWWRAHVRLQTLGVLAATAALAIVFGRGAAATRAAQLHHWLGWTAMACAWLQVAGGLLRGTKGGPTAPGPRGDHYDMTRRRVIFEYSHKHIGWAALAVAVVATGVGLALADAPRWMPLAIALWWACFAVAFAAMQRAGWCVDTYQAIWGPDPAHPGNGRRPIGRGIRRR